METKQSTTYHCGYCPKYYLRKYHAAKHEDCCHHNPKNKHKCFDDCKHLKKITISMCDEWDSERSFNSFVCQKQKDKPVYSYKAEKSYYFDKMLIDMTDHHEIEPERMPLQCNIYEPINYNS